MTTPQMLAVVAVSLVVSVSVVYPVTYLVAKWILESRKRARSKSITPIWDLSRPVIPPFSLPRPSPLWPPAKFLGYLPTHESPLPKEQAKNDKPKIRIVRFSK